MASGAFLDSLLRGGAAIVPNTGRALSADAQLELAASATLGALPTGNSLFDGETVTAYGRNWAFDFEAGQLERYGGGVVETTGLATLRTWIEKSLRTRRAAHVIYSDDYGITLDDEIFGNQYEGVDMMTLSEQIEETLLHHDRITAVEDIEITRPDPDDDYLLVAFTVVTDTDRADMEIEL